VECKSRKLFFNAKGGYSDDEDNQLFSQRSKAFIAIQQGILQTMDSNDREVGVSSGKNIFTPSGPV
jgi:hypothetical protein